VIQREARIISKPAPNSAREMEPVMSRNFAIALMTVFCLVLACHALVDDNKPKEPKPVPPVLNFTMNSLDGKPVDLSKYAGKVVLIVNVASKCGYTPQYKQLQALHEKFADKGLTILGFPANDFGKQEPGTNEEIASFCAKNYGVEFDMFAKVAVTGDDKCALYEFLTSEKTDPDHAGEVKWNFEKFLIGRNGEIVNRFRSKVEPSSEEMVKAIETELARLTGAKQH
jgi:glutathione peroxidase